MAGPFLPENTPIMMGIYFDLSEDEFVDFKLSLSIDLLQNFSIKCVLFSEDNTQMKGMNTKFFMRQAAVLQSVRPHSLNFDEIILLPLFNLFHLANLIFRVLMYCTPFPLPYVANRVVKYLC